MWTNVYLCGRGLGTRGSGTGGRNTRAPPHLMSPRSKRGRRGGPRPRSPEPRDERQGRLPMAGRIAALFEVILCSDYPTQLALGVTMNAAGFSPLNANGQLSLGYVVTLSLVDTALLVGLI